MSLVGGGSTSIILGRWSECSIFCGVEVHPWVGDHIGASRQRFYCIWCLLFGWPSTTLPQISTRCVVEVQSANSSIDSGRDCLYEFFWVVVSYGGILLLRSSPNIIACTYKRRLSMDKSCSLIVIHLHRRPWRHQMKLSSWFCVLIIDGCFYVKVGGLDEDPRTSQRLVR